MVARNGRSDAHPHQVWARTLWLALDSAKGGGIDLAPLFEGLPFDEKGLKKMLRVDWDDYCTCVERIEAAAGGPEGVRALARAHYFEGITEMRELAGRFIPPKVIFRFIFDVLDPVVFPPLDFNYEDIDASRARVEIWIRPKRGCEALLRATHGALEAMPMALGLPPAKVTAEMNDHYARYDIAYGPSQNAGRAFPARALARLIRAFVLGHKSDGTPLAATMAEEDGTAFESRVELAAHTWDLTPRQSDVLRCLAEGKSNKEIAVALDCAESTVETHVTQILARTKMPSRSVLIARFWSEL